MRQSGRGLLVRTRLLVFVNLALFSLYLSAYAQEKPTNLSEARDAIEANLKTAEGKAYDAQLGKEFPEKYLSTLRECKKAADGDLSSFWILAKLDKDGVVKEVLLSKTTKFASCARDALLKGKFGAPPRAGYWVGIYLNLSH